MSEKSLKSFARGKLRVLRDGNLLRTLIATERLPRTRTRQQSRDLISFACNDYLGLSHHPTVIEASRKATSTYGTGAGASRLISGNNPLYAGLEAALAKLKGTEDAVVFGSGYLANVGVVPALAARRDLILMDELCHACLHAGATLARSRTIRYRHLDLAELSGLLREHRPAHRHCLVLTDGVFSMDGDRAPVEELLGICEEHDAWLMTDDAHGLGVVENGRGSGFVGRPCRADTAADGHIVQGRRRLRRVPVHERGGGGPDPQPRQEPALRHRPASGHAGGGDRRA